MFRAKKGRGKELSSASEGRAVETIPLFGSSRLELLREKKKKRDERRNTCHLQVTQAGSAWLARRKEPAEAWFVAKGWFRPGEGKKTRVKSLLGSGRDASGGNKYSGGKVGIQIKIVLQKL